MPAAPELLERLEALLAGGRPQDVLRLHGEASPADPAADLAAARAAGRTAQFPAAERLARRALQGWTDPEDPRGLARAANVLGGIAFERGQLDQAEEWFELALRRAYPLGEIELAARTTTNLGSIASVRGRPQLALSFYHSALNAYRRLDDPRGQCESGHNLALVYRQCGNLARALQFAELAVGAADRLGDPGLRGLSLLGRAEIAMARGDAGAARADLATARRFLSTGTDPLTELEADRLDALLSLSERRPRAALRRASRAYLRSVAAGALQLQAECAMVVDRAAWVMRRPGTARRFRRIAVEALQALGARTLLQGWSSPPLDPGLSLTGELPSTSQLGS
jgi:tetratricopeptide (TPR) repeat protein